MFTLTIHPCCYGDLGKLRMTLFIQLHHKNSYFEYLLQTIPNTEKNAYIIMLRQDEKNLFSLSVQLFKHAATILPSPRSMNEKETDWGKKKKKNVNKSLILDSRGYRFKIVFL